MGKYTDAFKENQQLMGGALQACHVKEGFMDVHKNAISAGKLSVKEKELIALGIAIAIRCEGCILAHTHAAVEAGATLEEISETVDTVILMQGGPGVVYSGKAIAMAKEFLENK
ncbi:carboxymuconolactone decarboxylase family protein [Atopobacter sp. AH10]|uniref:carboxymuconolactone decarboxylase family protein n=1 Tax=Atopobacter sp. AH10 TaxID=2315861 RepID=UPI000EF21D4D|nr:carboxymuconolactone decarboxylase family protein [Atopobacter sp. AH10]RLK63430.1 carboxymuconolactone decarboxylase family protein [Atopobacter sp. AH10]